MCSPAPAPSKKPVLRSRFAAGARRQELSEPAHRLREQLGRGAAAGERVADEDHDQRADPEPAFPSRLWRPAMAAAIARKVRRRRLR